jgi:molybdopterin-guanine dinucleotide biosynthesis protein A
MSALFPGVILSGGKSSRMGEAKALLSFGEGRLIDHVADRLRPQVKELYLNSNDPAIALPAIQSFGDRFAGFHGPLAGIHAALAHVREAGSPASHVAIMPVDAPFFPLDLVTRLEAALSGPDDIALTMSGGRMHPVIGLWPVSLETRLGAWLADPPTLKVRAFLDSLPFRPVAFAFAATEFGDIDPFFNVNTREDLEFARKIRDAGGL